MNNKLKHLLKEFLHKSNVRKTFKFIAEKEIVGCEKWFQIEFYRFLDEHPNIPSDEIFKEDPYNVDQRKERYRNKIKIDITFRINYGRKYIPLELKHCNEFCLRYVNQELTKLSKIRPSDKKYYFNTAFLLILHPFITEHEIRDKIKNKIDDKFEFMIPVLKNKFSCTVFSRNLLNCT